MAHQHHTHRDGQTPAQPQAHAHSHAHGADIDWAEARDRLTATARDYAPWYADLAAVLVEPADTLGLDVGAGGAGMAAALARAMRPAGRVLALDGTPEVVETARDNLAAAGLDLARAEAVHYNLESGLDGLRSVVPSQADVIWASGVVHHVGDQQGAVDALAQLLAPGGRLALAEDGLHIRHLPWDVGVGTPGLETRLDAAQEVWFGRMRAGVPGSVAMPYGWTEALRRAGLVDVSTRSTLLEKSAPLSESDAERAIAGLTHRVDHVRDADLLDPADADAWARLLDRTDSAWLGHRRDLHSLEVRTVYVGRR
jgi:SAM-dependent methyltransferase